MPKMYCMKCKQFAPIDIETKPIPKQTNCPNCGEVRETKNFPYWKEEFKELFHGYELWYKIVGKKNTTDTADSYTNQLADHLHSFFRKERIMLRPLGNTLYIMPPYCTTNEQLEMIYKSIVDCITSL